MGIIKSGLIWQSTFANEMHKPLIGVRDWDASPVPKRIADQLPGNGKM